MLIPPLSLQLENPPTTSKASAPIMVVDDDLAIQELLALLLEGEGYAVIIAGNGEEALACLKQQRPALVLLDLMMPVMDGWGFLEAIKPLNEFRNLPVLLLSASRDIANAAAQHNVKGFLSKPFDMNELLQYVQMYKGQ